MGTIERRMHPRIRVAVEVAITSESNFFAGRTRDMSESGVFVETPVALPVGARIEVELTLPRSRHTVTGEVMWVLGRADGTTEGVGVRFVDPPARTRAAIVRFMERRAPMPYEFEDVEVLA